MKKKTTLALILVLSICLGTYGYYKYDQNKRAQAHQEAEEALTLSFKNSDVLLKEFSAYDPSVDENTIVLEYNNGVIESKDIVEKHSGESISIQPERINLHNTGENKVKFTIISHDSYGNEITKEYEYVVDVVDTKLPSIEISDIWNHHLVSEEVDLNDYVVSVSDPVDGDLPYSEELKNGTYVIDTSEYIEDANGTYFVLVIAKDKNGNESYNGFRTTIGGGRELTEEEINHIFDIQDEYREFEIDEGATLNNISSLVKKQQVFEPETLNGTWISVMDRDLIYAYFEVDYPKVINWGPLEADIKKDNTQENTYEFIFEEDGEEPITIVFKLDEKDSGSLYYENDEGLRVKYNEVYKLENDNYVNAQPTKKRARAMVEAITNKLIDERVEIYEENKRKQEEARRRAEQAALAAQSAQQAQSGGTGEHSSTGSSGSTQPQTVDISGYTSQVASIVNQERAAAGLGEISMSAELNAAAQIRAEELVSLFSHTRPNGSSCFTVFDELGISVNAAGENIAAGQANPSSVMNSWMNSDGHRGNILNENYGHIGVGCVYIPGSQYGYYWVQLFSD